MTEFEKNIVKKLENNDLAKTSINFYLRCLKKLNDDKPINNLDFLDNKEKIKEFLEKKKPNTQRNYYIAMASILKLDPKKETLYKFYREKMEKMNKDLKEIESKNEKSETQKKNWMEQTEIQKIYEDLKNKVDSFKNDMDITKNKYNILLKYVILSLYYLFPPRRNKDYQETSLIKGISDKDLDDEKNYINLTTKKFIFNDFKTKKTEGEQIIDIPNELMDVLNIYVKFHPLIEKNEKKFDCPFIVNYEGIPLESSNTITLILNRTLHKKVGSSMLRHIYLSNKYGNLLTEQQKDAKIMAHSTGMQKDYIKK